MSATSPTQRSSFESPRAAHRLRISEIFLSLQGEADTAGAPTTFVRLTGCPLRCVYCDTAYAFGGGEVMAVEEILSQVAANGVEHVCVTGGEPLAQRSVLPLMRALCDEGHRVSLETSGALAIGEVDPRVVRVVDIKTPASGEVHRNLASNLELLGANDRVKFVLTDRADYEWSRRFIAEHALAQRCPVFLSPSHEVLAPRELADWIVADRLPVRLQVQLHKYLWGDMPGV
ncbi:MAG: 7-carboxy-7-deazaguanine synthase QueE [Pseudomonadota bacterium]